MRRLLVVFALALAVGLAGREPKPTAVLSDSPRGLQSGLFRLGDDGRVAAEPGPALPALGGLRNVSRDFAAPERVVPALAATVRRLAELVPRRLHSRTPLLLLCGPAAAALPPTRLARLQATVARDWQRLGLPFVVRADHVVAPAPQRQLFLQLLAVNSQRGRVRHDPALLGARRRGGGATSLAEAAVAAVAAVAAAQEPEEPAPAPELLGVLALTAADARVGRVDGALAVLPGLGLAAARAQLRWQFEFAPAAGALATPCLPPGAEQRLGGERVVGIGDGPACRAVLRRALGPASLGGAPVGPGPMVCVDECAAIVEAVRRASPANLVGFPRPSVGALAAAVDALCAAPRAPGTPRTACVDGAFLVVLLRDVLQLPDDAAAPEPAGDVDAAHGLFLLEAREDRSLQPAFSQKEARYEWALVAAACVIVAGLGARVYVLRDRGG